MIILLKFVSLIVISLLSLVSLLKSVALVQQKEYRLDRLLAFFATPNGWQNFWNGFKDWSWHPRNLKRPKLTVRVILILSVTILIGAGLMIWSWPQPMIWLLLWWIGFYLIIPGLVLGSIFPLEMVKTGVTNCYIWLARLKIGRAKPLIIGITGSYGKTSTKHLITHLLNQKTPTFTTPRSFNTILSVTQYFVKNYQAQPMMVLEYAAYKPGEIKKLAQIFPPNSAVITGLTPQHIALFGSVDNIIQAKSELVTALPSPKTVWVNGADAGALKIAHRGRCEHPQVVSTQKMGLTHIQLDDQGQLNFSWHSQLIKTKLIGRHYADIVALAMSVAEKMGMTQTEIATGLESFLPNSSYISHYQLVRGVQVIDDGKTSNPTGFTAALELVQEIKNRAENQSKKFSLLTGGIVDLGKESAKIHHQLALAAQEVFETVYYTGHDGQTEFKAVFGQNLITDRTQIRTELTKIGSDDWLLIEGSVPGWLQPTLVNKIG